MSAGQILASAFQNGLALREQRRQYDMNDQARAASHKLLEAAEQRLGRSLSRTEAEDFLSGPSAFEGVMPEVASPEMEELRRRSAADPAGFLADPESSAIRRRAMDKFGPAYAKLTKEQLEQRMRLAHASNPGFDSASRIELARAQAALKALLEGAKTDVPASGIYPFAIGTDGKPVQVGPDDLAKRRAAAAAAGAGAILGLDIPGMPPRPLYPRGSQVPVQGPTQPWPQPELRAPGGGVGNGAGQNMSHPATDPQAGPIQPPQPGGKASIIMKFKATGETHPVPVDEVAQALASGEWEYQIAPGFPQPQPRR